MGQPLAGALDGLRPPGITPSTRRRESALRVVLRCAVRRRQLKSKPTRKPGGTDVCASPSYPIASDVAKWGGRAVLLEAESALGIERCCLSKSMLMTGWFWANLSTAPSQKSFSWFRPDDLRFAAVTSLESCTRGLPYPATPGTKELEQMVRDSSPNTRSIRQTKVHRRAMAT